NAADAIDAATAPSGGVFGTPTQVSQSGTPAFAPALALDSSGDATAAWSQGSSGKTQAMAAGYDSGAGPENRDVTIPGTGMVGEPVTFSVSPFDVWPAITSTVWSFGDGTTATGAVVTHTYATAGTYNVSVTSLNADGNSTTTNQTPEGPVSSGTDP